ncbi:Myosin heavy chain kinase A [Bienertia sinuspersici]
MEPPECPVCLQSYDDTVTIPRVLSCGHSACQTCLTSLHHHSSSSHSLLPNTLRCPSCTQLIKFPHPQGPTALPKNIDLLRFHNQNRNFIPATKTSIKVKFSEFRPKVWSDEVVATWKDWILPNSVVLRNDECSGKIAASADFVGLTLSFVMRYLSVGSQEVRLIYVARFELDDHDHNPLFEYSYVGKVMSALCSMNDAQRNEISSLLGISLRNPKVCSLFGLWLDAENDGCLYLVTKKLKNGLLNMGKLGNGIDQVSEECGLYFGSIGVELCEVLMSLHSEGFVCGCLGLSCLCFDEFGHACVDIGEALMIGKKFRECVVEGVISGQNIDESEAETFILKMSNMDAFVSPEVLLELLHRETFGVGKKIESFAVCYASDVWLIACSLIKLLIKNHFAIEMRNYLINIFQGMNEGFSGFKNMYLNWVESMSATLKPLMVGDYASVYGILLQCLDFDPRNRPLAVDLWNCLRGLNMYHSLNLVTSLESISMKDSIGRCLVLGDLCNVSDDKRNDLRISKLSPEQDDCKPDTSIDGEVRVDNVVKGLSAGKVQCKVLQGHRDCISGLCAGGGFLFSSSFDKTINVWSLQDFTHVHTFRGHEHKVMALVFVNQEKPLCISADSGGGIFAWAINDSLAQEPLMKWYEDKDWRYSGIHALAVSEFGCLYTGSGDRVIKAWLLKDHSLLCRMEGHKSVVSTLAVFNGVLYSGSWDGTIRLWCLHDHSPLGIFGEDNPGTLSSVLSLFADQNMVIAAHENGCIKIWMNDVFKTSTKILDGAIFALAMEGKWIYFGGWDRSVKVQEITRDGSEMEILDVGSIACDSVITTLLCVQGLLFVGYANTLIKVKHSR